jgi:uncharacterized protein (DUF302 family)
MSRDTSKKISAVVERTYVDTTLPYQSAIEAFEAAVGRFEPAAAATLAERGAPWPEFEAAMTTTAGPSGLMILGKFDQGAVASLAGTPIRCRLYLVGNPAIAARIVRIDERACLYVPFRVAIYETRGASGATISFDRPSASLRTLDNPELEPIGQTLDQKIDDVVQSIQRGG